MPKPSTADFEGELRVFTIGTERVVWLGRLVATARSDFKPRDFAERYLVDDLAICRWRGSRIALMEKAIFEHQASTFRPRIPKNANGDRLMPHEDIYHLAMAHNPEAHATVLAALNRLDTRYHRQFCTSLRLLIGLRRGGQPPVEDTAIPSSPKQASKAGQKQASRKENTPCEPSSITPLMM